MVLDILSGQVLTSRQVSESMVGMVFLPVAMGAVAPPEELRVLLMGSASPPETLDGDPPKPEFPGYPEVTDPPEKPVLAKLDPQMLRDLEWGDVDEEDVEEARVQIKAGNTRLIREWDEASMAWHKAQSDRDLERVRIDAEYDAAVGAWQADLIDHAGQARERLRLHDEWVEKHDRIFSEWGADIGAVTGCMKDSFPRSINGYPMFHAVKIVHKDDWTRIEAAVLREQDRAKTIEV
jgi:hypothetical protein